MKILLTSSLLFLSSLLVLQAQEVPDPEQCYVPIIDQISQLESNRDPKCHATASRLEDFMYGTPLSEEARIARMAFQKRLAREIWQKASSLSTDPRVSAEHIVEVGNSFLTFTVRDDQWFVGLADAEFVELDPVDFRQYSSVAYGLRAILAVQQENLFETEDPLKILSQEAVERLKFVVDIASLAALKLADYDSRGKDIYEVGKESLDRAWNRIVLPWRQGGGEVSTVKIEDYSGHKGDYAMIKKSIDQKLASYVAYNQIGQSVFMRNIQVYFAKVPWPQDKTESEQVENIFREALIYFAMDLVHFAQDISKSKGEATISFETMKSAVDAFLPYKLNKFEDVIYFPLLPKEQQVVIEAYDLDAFRDSGVHWQYLKFAIEDPSFKGYIEPDPFAAEMLVEAIAQLGVLIWRKAGEFSKKEGSEYLTGTAMTAGMDDIRELIRLNNSRYGTDDVDQQKIVSTDEEATDSPDLLFEDVTANTTIQFVHRSADWMSRQIRSYVVKEDENLARLAIPPAFGGGGAAAEDLDGDGWVDVLLLSGSGNKIYRNNGDRTFTDITSKSGIDWQREDGHYAEPRQPIIADFDNDGIQDLFISYVDDYHRIFKGNGDGTFTDMTEKTGLGGRGLVGGPCTALDYDKDGLLDLYIGYFGNYLKGELPTLERHNTNGTPNKLFRNKGNFVFEDVSSGSGVENSGWTQAVGHSDINNDGWQDLIVGNDFGKNSYYINQGNGQFVDASVELGTDKPSYTMNVGIADLNRDAYPDFYISNIVVMEKDDKYVSPNKDTRMHFNASSLATMRIVEANDLFLSRAPGEKGLSYENSQLVGRGYSSTGWAWDADFFDYDNDGDEDLYCLNGMNDYSVYGTDNPYYSSPMGETSPATFAESARERNVFFENRDGMLNNESELSGLDIYHTSRSAAYLDYDLDGDLDIVMNNYHGDAYFFENKSERRGNHWLKVRLKAVNIAGITRDAIGAKVLVSTDRQKNMWREVHSTTGYLSGHPKELHFGLGKSTTARIKVIWPDGKKEEREVKEVDRVVEFSRS